jgi:hypothetical protein
VTVGQDLFRWNLVRRALPLLLRRKRRNLRSRNPPKRHPNLKHLNSQSLLLKSKAAEKPKQPEPRKRSLRPNRPLLLAIGVRRA